MRHHQAKRNTKKRSADHGERLGMLYESQEEARALLEASRLHMAREDLVDLLATRVEKREPCVRDA